MFAFRWLQLARAGQGKLSLARSGIGQLAPLSPTICKQRANLGAVQHHPTALVKKGFCPFGTWAVQKTVN
jgi:hypothetical protein